MPDAEKGTPCPTCGGGTLAQRLYVALVEQRVIDSQKYGEAPYAPITPEDAARELACALPPAECSDCGCPMSKHGADGCHTMDGNFAPCYCATSPEREETFRRGSDA